MLFITDVYRLILMGESQAEGQTAKLFFSFLRCRDKFLHVIGFFLLFYARISLTTLYIYAYRAVCLRRHNITNKRLTSNTMGDYLDLGMIVFFSIKITYY